MRFTVMVELAPDEYAKHVGVTDRAKALIHAKKYVPTAIREELESWPGLNPRVTHVVVDDEVGVVLSQQQIRTLLNAMAEKTVETKQYLSRYPTGREGHDDCCEVAQRRSAARAEERALLEERERQERELIDLLEAVEVREPRD